MRWIVLLAGLALLAPPDAAWAQSPRKAAGATQRGLASFYAERFHGRRMANGERFDRNADNAAHRSLPFGTRVEVRNLDNGRSAVAEILDRGPFAKGRIIDLSPRTAAALGMRRKGLARVAVTPLAPAAEAAGAARRE